MKGHLIEITKEFRKIIHKYSLVSSNVFNISSISVKINQINKKDYI